MSDEETGLEKMSDAELAEADRQADQPAPDPNAGKVQLAGHWVGAGDLIPLAREDCKLCNGNGIVSVTAIHKPSRKPVLRREVCQCCMEEFLLRHQQDLRDMVTVNPGDPVVRLRKPPKLKGPAGAKSNERVERLEAARAKAEQELQAVERKIERATEPARRELAAIDLTILEQTREIEHLVEKLQHQWDYLHAGETKVKSLEAELEAARSINRAHADAIAKLVAEEANLKQGRLKVLVEVEQAKKKIESIAGKFRRETGALRRDIERYEKKIATIKSYAGSGS